MDIDDVLPPLPLEPPDDFGLDQSRAPPPPPLQTSSDAEVMDVSAGGDGHSYTPGDEEAKKQELMSKGSLIFCSHLSNETSPNPRCPRTARHAPQVTKFLPDLKQLRDVKISVSFTESSSSSSSSSTNKDRKVLYTGEGQETGSNDDLMCLNGEIQDMTSILDVTEGGSGAGNAGGRKSEESEVDLENKVEFAVLDELEDYYENFLDRDDGEQDGFKSDAIVQQEQVGDETAAYTYEEGFDNDVDALLEEGMPVPKKMRLAEDKYPGDSDHQSDGDGEGSVQPMKHDPPTSSIPCLHYKKMKDQEERELNGEVTSNVEEPALKASVVEKADKSAEEQGENISSTVNEGQGRELEEFRFYLEKCFDFEQVTVKKFRTWAERRQFNRDMKRKQAESERPILPANQKLITLSVQDAPTKKGEMCSHTDTHTTRTWMLCHSHDAGLHSLVTCCTSARATLEILIPDFVKQTSEEKPVEGDELEVRCCIDSTTLVFFCLISEAL
ncbi:hypothetical protein GOODEAATRI_018144 [Goodea atripinnis]|uniref:Uncharacterized protein n=1 Tax=Goodea atripinnis TaxID=208336 RepID=A0ABV0PPL5_9TELE